MMKNIIDRIKLWWIYAITSSRIYHTDVYFTDGTKFYFWTTGLRDIKVVIDDVVKSDTREIKDLIVNHIA